MPSYGRFPDEAKEEEIYPDESPAYQAAVELIENPPSQVLIDGARYYLFDPTSALEEKLIYFGDPNTDLETNFHRLLENQQDEIQVQVAILPLDDEISSLEDGDRVTGIFSAPDAGHYYDSVLDELEWQVEQQELEDGAVYYLLISHIPLSGLEQIWLQPEQPPYDNSPT